MNRNEMLMAYRRTRRGVLTVRYSDMSRRTKGKFAGDGKSTPWKGLPCMPCEEFVAWSLSDQDFERLFVEWEASGFQRRCSPSISRIDRFEGYVLANVRWVSHLENSREALALGQLTRATNKARDLVAV